MQVSDVACSNRCSLVIYALATTDTSWVEERCWTHSTQPFGLSLTPFLYSRSVMPTGSIWTSKDESLVHSEQVSMGGGANSAESIWPRRRAGAGAEGYKDGEHEQALCLICWTQKRTLQVTHLDRRGSLPLVNLSNRRVQRGLTAGTATGAWTHCLLGWSDKWLVITRIQDESGR